jgi:hypothetical protein
MKSSLYLARVAPREFGLFQLEGESFTLLGSSSLINLLSDAVDRIEKSPSTSFTFTCRTVEELASAPDPLDPADPGGHLEALRARKVIPPIVTVLLATGEAHRSDIYTMVSWSSGRLYGY